MEYVNLISVELQDEMIYQRLRNEFFDHLIRGLREAEEDVVKHEIRGCPSINIDFVFERQVFYR